MIERLPNHDAVNHGIELAVEGTKFSLASRAAGAETWTKVPVADARVVGRPVKVILNHQLLTKALRFGLATIHIIDPLTPLTFSREGRKMVVMPLRSATASTSPVAEETAPVASTAENETAPANSAGAQPKKEEPMPRTNTPTAAPATNGDGSNGHNGEEAQKPALELALEQIETIKGSLKTAKTGLNDLAETLKQVQRDQKTSEKEVEGVRAALGKLQQVRL